MRALASSTSDQSVPMGTGTYMFNISKLSSSLMMFSVSQDVNRLYAPFSVNTPPGVVSFFPSGGFHRHQHPFHGSLSASLPDPFHQIYTSGLHISPNPFRNIHIPGIDPFLPDMCQGNIASMNAPGRAIYQAFGY